MAKNTVHEYARALYDLTRGLSGEELKKTIKAFAELLYKKNILKKSGLIIAEYEKIAKREAGLKEIKITTAHELNKQTLDQIKKVFGGNVEAKTVVDESIIGGMIVKTEDAVLDASLKTQLRALQEHLA